MTAQPAARVFRLLRAFKVDWPNGHVNGDGHALLPAIAEYVATLRYHPEPVSKLIRQAPHYPVRGLVCLLCESLLICSIGSRL